ncbi:MAG: hypothetical protein EBU46_01425 [Nitrosomonadaceae bacterium]|nr:hypothetical protein [Nitrosomonadaceae bacterium]
MDEEEEKQIRHKMLVALIKDAGGNTNFIEKYQRKDLEGDEEISVTFISQLKNKYRPFGYKAARKIERLSTLPNFYFDPWRNESESAKTEVNIQPSSVDLLKMKIKKMIDDTNDETKLKQIVLFIGYLNFPNKNNKNNDDKKLKVS